MAGEVPGRTGRMGNRIPRSPRGVNLELVRKEVSPRVYIKGKQVPSEGNRGNIKLVRVHGLLNNSLTSFVTELGFLCKVLGILNGLLSLLYSVQPQNHKVTVNGTSPNTSPPALCFAHITYITVALCTRCTSLSFSR